MTFAVVSDVPASWEHYEPLAASLRGAVPPGLVLHVAGPTDEGFRTIEVWESRKAWERFRDRRAATEPGRHQWAPPTLRELPARNTIHGAQASQDGKGN